MSAALISWPGNPSAVWRWELGILFPSGEQMQCWDSKLVYSYFRLTADNHLLLGGGTPITTFLKEAYNNPGVIRRIIKDFRVTSRS